MDEHYARAQGAPVPSRDEHTCCFHAIGTVPGLHGPFVPCIDTVVCRCCHCGTHWAAGRPLGTTEVARIVLHPSPATA